MRLGFERRAIVQQGSQECGPFLVRPWASSLAWPIRHVPQTHRHGSARSSPNGAPPTLRTRLHLSFGEPPVIPPTSDAFLVIGLFTTAITILALRRHAREAEAHHLTAQEDTAGLCRTCCGSCCCECYQSDIYDIPGTLPRCVLREHFRAISLVMRARR
jgi:hypothetical protein